jgi:hypothetical protein
MKSRMFKMSESFLPSSDVLEHLVLKWGTPPDTKTKCRTDQYMRMMKILYGRYENYEQWLKEPGMKKQMEMNLGNFVQEYIGNLKNHVNYKTGHETSLDGENVKEDGTKIIYEMKIDEKTTNDASLKKSIERLEGVAKTYKVQPLLIQFFRRSKISEKNKFKDILISGEDYLNKHVSPSIGGIDGLISHIERHFYLKSASAV